MPRQAQILLLALVLWALVAVVLGVPGTALWAAVASYGLAWAAVNVIAVLRPALLEMSMSRGRAAIVVALVAVVPLSVLWSRGEALLEHEGLRGSLASSEDRARLEATPSVAPPLVRSDRPQTFYVHAPGAGSVELSPGPGADLVSATSLGHGLFRRRSNPRLHGIASNMDGTVDARVVVDGTESRRALSSVVARAHPRWLRGSPSRRLAATVSEETDEVIVIGAAGLVARVEVGDGPSDCAFLDERRLVVTQRFGEELFIVDAERGRVLDSIPLTPHQRRVAVGPDFETVAVAVEGPEPGVFVVETHAGSAPGSVRDFIPSRPDWLAFGADAATLIVTLREEARLERWQLTAHGRRVTALELGRPAVTLAVSPDGRRAMVATTDYRADGSIHYGNHFVQDQLLTVDLDTPAVVDQHLTARRSSRQGGAGNVDRGVSPMGIDMRDDGGTRVAFAGTDEVWRLSAGPRPQVVDTREVLSVPHSVFTFADGTFAVTSPADGALALFEPTGELRELIQLEPDDDALLAESEHALARRMGERTFYEGTRTGITCQSCHLHADTDHVLRNIGERRLSPTLSVRGLAGTAPFLRDGSYPRIRDLEHLARTLFRGYVRDAPGRAHTLEVYVESLPRRPSHALFAERDLARERRGLDVFVGAGCTSCHALPAFTNLGRHPVGALFPDRAADLGADAPLDVPSLVGLGRGGPYFTDARAESLEAVVREHNEHDRHGRTSSLSDEEVADLVHFLEAL